MLAQVTRRLQCRHSLVHGACEFPRLEVPRGLSPFHAPLSRLGLCVRRFAGFRLQDIVLGRGRLPLGQLAAEAPDLSMAMARGNASLAGCRGARLQILEASTPPRADTNRRGRIAWQRTQALDRAHVSAIDEYGRVCFATERATVGRPRREARASSRREGACPHPLALRSEVD